MTLKNLKTWISFANQSLTPPVLLSNSFSGASAVLILGHAAVMQEGIEGDFVATV